LGGSGFASGSGSSGEIGRERVAATREQLMMQSQMNGNKRSEKPPKLPPRDSGVYPQMMKVRMNFIKAINDIFNIKKILFQPDYDDIEDENRVKLMQRGKSDKGKDNKKYGECQWVKFFISC
jgi:hypothetical protein